MTARVLVSDKLSPTAVTSTLVLPVQLSVWCREQDSTAVRLHVHRLILDAGFQLDRAEIRIGNARRTRIVFRLSCRSHGRDVFAAIAQLVRAYPGVKDWQLTTQLPDTSEHGFGGKMRRSACNGVRSVHRIAC